MPERSRVDFEQIRFISSQIPNMGEYGKFLQDIALLGPEEKEMMAILKAVEVSTPENSRLHIILRARINPIVKYMGYAHKNLEEISELALFVGYQEESGSGSDSSND